MCLFILVCIRDHIVTGVDCPNDDWVGIDYPNIGVDWPSPSRSDLVT
jgi:hypothetical protein